MMHKLLAWCTFLQLAGFIVDLGLVVFGLPSHRGAQWYAAGSLQVAILVLAIALMPIYLARILSNEDLTTFERVIWAFSVIFLSVFAMPTYYLRYLRARS
jgi:hypothetical protein